MLPTGVTAPTAHSSRHGNRDEHSYLGPDIHRLWNSDLSFSYIFLSPYLFLSVLFTWCMTCSRELEVWDSVQRAFFIFLNCLNLCCCHSYCSNEKYRTTPIDWSYVCVCVGKVWAFKSPLTLCKRVCLCVWNGFLASESLAKAGTS